MNTREQLFISADQYESQIDERVNRGSQLERTRLYSLMFMMLPNRFDREAARLPVKVHSSAVAGSGIHRVRMSLLGNQLSSGMDFQAVVENGFWTDLKESRLKIIDNQHGGFGCSPDEAYICPYEWDWDAFDSARSVASADIDLDQYLQRSREVPMVSTLDLTKTS